MTTNSSPVAGDTILLFQGQDWDAISTMTTPTGGGTWTQLGTGWDAGANNPGIKIWTRPVTTGGAQTITINGVNGDFVCASYIVFAGSATFGTPAGTATSASSTTCIAPSVTAATATDLLFTAYLSLTFSGSAVFTVPTGMTAQDERNNGTTSDWLVARLQLSASGATGTKTAPAGTSSQGYVAVAITASDPAPSGPPPGRFLIATA